MLVSKRIIFQSRFRLNSALGSVSSIKSTLPRHNLLMNRHWSSNSDGSEDSLLIDDSSGAVVIENLEEKGLVPASNVPKLNPIIALPWVRRPVFPG